MPRGNHAGGELVAIETDSTSGPRQDRELVQGVGERLHTRRLVLGPIDRVLVKPNVVTSPDDSSGGLILVVSSNDETEGWEDETDLESGKAEANGNGVHGFLVI
jgi:hypothetical protein